MPSNYTYNFTGQRLDSETDLFYYNVVFYDPVTWRFVRLDTVQTMPMECVVCQIGSYSALVKLGCFYRRKYKESLKRSVTGIAFI